MIDGIILLVKKLQDRYGASISFEDYLSRQYGENPVEIDQDDKEQYRRQALFDQNPTNNDNTLRMIIERFQKYEKQLERLQMKDADRNAKKKYIDAISKLRGDKNIGNGKYVAEEMRKFFKRYLFKLLEQSEYKEIITSYLEECGIRLESFQPNSKVSDAKMEVLDMKKSMLYSKYKDVAGYEVIEMIHPVIHVYYIDEEDEVEEALIEGVCSMYTQNVPATRKI